MDATYVRSQPKVIHVRNAMSAELNPVKSMLRQRASQKKDAQEVNEMCGTTRV